MPYIYNLQELASGQKPASASGPPYDHLWLYITLALAERVEALVAEMAKLNDNQAGLTMISQKMDALVQATQNRATSFGGR